MHSFAVPKATFVHDIQLQVFLPSNTEIQSGQNLKVSELRWPLDSDTDTITQAADYSEERQQVITRCECHKEWIRYKSGELV